MGGGKGSSSSGDTTTTIRFAPYIEEKHKAFLDETVKARIATIDSSPFSSYVDEDPYTAFLGIGYVISDFPALEDMFGKYMAGFDVEVLFNLTFSDMTTKVELDGAVKARIRLVDQAHEEKTVPEFLLGMRDLNAVNSSSFSVGRSLIEANKIRDYATASSEVVFSSIPIAFDKYRNSLNWQKLVVTQYAAIMKEIYVAEDLNLAANNKFAYEDALWPMQILYYERTNLAAMRGLTTMEKKMSPRKRSTISKVFLVASYTATGATIGAQIGGYYGAVVGGAIGFVVGIAYVLFE